MRLSSDVLAAREKASAVAAVSDRREVDGGRIRTFWRTVARFPPGAAISRDPKSSQIQFMVMSGWISEMRILADGRRQIFGFLLPGDVDTIIEPIHLGSRELVALTHVEIADAAALATDEDGERLARSLNHARREREERLLDQIVRVGRLNAKERVLNLLLELCDRLDAIGLVADNSFRFPLTQEMFADALGLSVVHINRTLQQLRREGLLTIGRGEVTLHQRSKLAVAACYGARA